MYDTLRYVKKLEAIGDSRAHAEAQVEIMADLVDQNFATKSDLEKMQLATSADFDKLRTYVDRRFDKMQSDLDSRFDGVTREFQLVRSEFNTKLGELSDRLLLRTGLMIAASTTITISVLALIIRH